MDTETSKAEIRAWMERWRLVNEAERAELQSTPAAVKFRQLAKLMHTARVLNWKSSTEEEDEVVRQRWIRLKRKLRDTR